MFALCCVYETANICQFVGHVATCITVFDGKATSFIWYLEAGNKLIQSKKHVRFYVFCSIPLHICSYNHIIFAMLPYTWKGKGSGHPFVVKYLENLKTNH